MKQVPREKLVKGTLSLYEQMRLKILELIKERGLKPHDPVPSESELADRFGVSRRTSKEALLALAEEGVVYRLPRRGTFLADPSEIGAASGAVRDKATDKMVAKKQYLAMVVPSLDDYIGPLVSAALQEAAELGKELIIRISEGDIAREGLLLKELASEAAVQGIILFPGNRRTCGDEVLRLHLEKYPIVIVDRTFREVDIPSVHHDHYQGAYELTSYMIAKGHRQIGFVSEDWLGVLSRKQRYLGFLQALMDHNVTIRNEWIHAEPDTQGGAQRLEAPDEKDGRLKSFLRRNNELTAIFCSNDYIALKVLNTAAALGKKVPEELSLSGFTDVRFAGLLSVPLTTVRKPPDTIGKAAVQLLCGRIANPGEEAKSLKLPIQLIERESIVERREE